MFSEKDLKDDESIGSDDDSSLTFKDILNSNEAAKYLGLSVQALLNRASSGTIPYYKLGRLNRYKKSELTQILLSNKRGNHGNYKRTTPGSIPGKAPQGY